MGEWVVPGKPDESELLERTTNRSLAIGKVGMPVLGSERIDTTAVALLRKWIDEMK
jgi:hypothetical protein